MEKINNGGPAFPTGEISGRTTHGITLRDWFAGQALSGSLSQNNLHASLAVFAAKRAYKFADALLLVRTGDDDLGTTTGKGKGESLASAPARRGPGAK